MRIAVPITACSMDDVLKDMDIATEVADIIELRLDLMSNPNLERLLRHSPKPKIVMNRTKFEGGRFDGSEEKRVSYLQEAIGLRAEYIDIEADHYFPFERHSTKIIVSHHNFERTPENLEEIYKKIADKNPDIVKIATKAQNYRDSLRMLNLIAGVNRHIIGICMGQQGMVTRILGPFYGNYLTFATLEEGKSSTPGQLSVAKLRSAWQLLHLE